MNLRSLAELLTLISAHSPNLIEAEERIPLDALHRYWSCSRAQARLWSATLEALRETRCGGIAADILPIPPRMEATLNDILIGGMLARVWGAILSARDRHVREDDAAPIAMSVLAQHNIVGNQMLRLLVDDMVLPCETAARIDQLRRRIERWTDVLIGHLVCRYGVTDFAFDIDRAHDFGDEQLSDTWSARELQIWDLYLTCLRGALPPLPLPGGRLYLLREEIAGQMLASFSPDFFQAGGALKSVWLQRLEFGGTRPKKPFGLLKRRLDERLSS